MSSLLEAAKAAAARKAEESKKATKSEYKIRPWVGSKGAVEGKLVMSSRSAYITLDQLVAWGCDLSKVRQSVDLSKMDDTVAAAAESLFVPAPPKK